MEKIIDGLLDAFERGHMSRRQLVRNLAVATVSAPLVGTATAAQAAPAGGASAFRTDGLDHISYAVADYGRSRDFYVDLMGWEVREDTGENQATLRIGEVGDIIIRNGRRQDGEPTVIAPGRGNRPPVTGVINHIAWRIDDFQTDAVREELERRGLNPRRDQGPADDGYDSYHVLDPDGWDLQISGWKPED